MAYFTVLFRRAVIVAIGMNAANIAVAADKYDGVYRPVGQMFAGWDCTTIGQDGGAIAIKKNVVYGIENNCKLTNPVNVNGMTATLYDANCAGEGNSWRSRVMIMKADFGLYYISDQFVASWQNCPSR
ncbi:hypothetical protein GCM10008927_01490 [Amylibacter ulvae]|uniref:Uncharacterized protein n=1 Tax=Paramylibacter ulvae TaxID=1651968 RepID=A0ABQ3CTZ7_9RHOB|nr:hypothetical protein [Amylibacter ulvae]GHA40940.1 hypothetical protein GCM10008927_01490 [Amylibacter ulvae]